MLMPCSAAGHRAAPHSTSFPSHGVGNCKILAFRDANSGQSLYCAVSFSLLHPNLSSSPSDPFFLVHSCLSSSQSHFKLHYLPNTSFLFAFHVGFLATSLVDSGPQDDCSTQTIMFTLKEGSGRSSSVNEPSWHMSLFFGKGELFNPAHPWMTL